MTWFVQLLDGLVRWWMRQCPHEGQHVAADILEGAMFGKHEVRLCRRCGATRSVFPEHGTASEWRHAEPQWFKPGKECA